MPWPDPLSAIGRAARLMVGMPDYDVYAAHRRAHHPGEPVMSRSEFHRERTERRYGGGPDRIGRCC